jgi:hypothetical protein
MPLRSRLGASRMTRATTRTTCWSHYKGTRCWFPFRGPPITEAATHASRRGRAVVQAPMAQTTKCDQVFFRVVPKQAPRSDVVNFEILQRPASLAAVPLQHSQPKCLVQFRIEPQSRSSLPCKNRRNPCPFPRFSTFPSTFAGRENC